MEDIAQAILWRLRLVLLVVLGFVGPILAFTFSQPPVYEASATAVLEPVWGASGMSAPEEISSCSPLPFRYLASVPWK
jgi:uncharacterized protein involved in exopolysaccharide biosynthesis